MKKKITTEATVLNTCDGIVGSLSTFHKELRENGFAGARVKITYEILLNKTKKNKEFIKLLKDGSYQKRVVNFKK